DRLRIVELRRDRTRLAPKERVPGEGFPGVELVTGQLAHALGDVPDPLQAQVRFDAVERTERQGDLAEARVARTLSHAVDRALDPGRPGAHRRDRARGGEPEVVVSVEVNWDSGQ